jgi:hypothetical protein
LRGLCALGGKNFAGLSGRKGTARQALVGGIDPEGKVYEHLSRQGNIQYAYAGEMLQVLTGLAIPGDIDLSGGVDFVDLAIFADNWRSPENPGTRIGTNFPEIV